MNTANARKRTVNARMHSFGRGVRFEVAVVWRQGDGARLGAAIEVDLRGRGYGSSGAPRHGATKSRWSTARPCAGTRRRRARIAYLAPTDPLAGQKSRSLTDQVLSWDARG